MQTDLLTPADGLQNLSNTENPYYIWDLGRETAGLVQLKIDAPAGVIVDLAWGEHLTEHGVAAHIGGRNFANRYITKEGEQTHYCQLMQAMAVFNDLADQKPPFFVTR